MKKKRLLFSLFFLTILTLVNSSSLHVLAHEQGLEDDCIEDCTLCSVALEIQLEDDFLPSGTQNLNFDPPILVVQNQDKHQDLVLANSTPAKLFCRPPPQTI